MTINSLKKNSNTITTTKMNTNLKQGLKKMDTTIVISARNNTETIKGKTIITIH